MLLFSLSFTSFSIAFSIAQSNPSCQGGWIYFAKSNKCVKFFGWGDGIPMKTWGQAEEYCNFFNGHLASVDSDDEITAIIRLAQATGYDHPTDYSSRAHIGLTFEPAREWVHPDGSSLVYLKWYPYDPGTGGTAIDGRFPCGMISTRKKMTGYMWVGGSDETYQFACETAPIGDGGK